MFGSNAEIPAGVTPEEHFWAHVSICPYGGCWEWTGYRKSVGGYGLMVHKVAGGVKFISAHRLAYELFFEHPGKLHVCHSCDNPSCVNPAHLWLGTNTDNVRDKRAKLRGKGQENQPSRVAKTQAES